MKYFLVGLAALSLWEGVRAGVPDEYCFAANEVHQVATSNSWQFKNGQADCKGAYCEARKHNTMSGIYHT